MHVGKFILLHDDDNVLVCCQAVQAGEVITMNSNALTIRHDVAVGHKIARRYIAAGDKIIKYGVSIGSATKTIMAGEHVHLHNMQSDYIAAHGRERLADISKHK